MSETTIAAAPLRPPMRPPSRPAPAANDSAALAAKRADEILAGLDESVDTDGYRFAAPPPPEGWDYEWKRKLTMGQPDAVYMAECQRLGWQPVPLARHRHMMPPDWSGGETIERDGMLLMERPLVVSERFKQREIDKAKAQLDMNRSNVAQAAPNSFDRRVNHYRTTVETIPVPD